jgi:hypothetical protein
MLFLKTYPPLKSYKILDIRVLQGADLGSSHDGSNISADDVCIAHNNMQNEERRITVFSSLSQHWFRLTEFYQLNFIT